MAEQKIVNLITNNRASGQISPHIIKMASFPPNLSIRPTLSSRLSLSQISHHLSSSTQTRPSPPPPPPPEPPPVPIPASPPFFSDPSAAARPPGKKWSSLFESKPRNAGSFSPPPMKLHFKGKALQPTDEVYAAAEEQWDGYLVGHFLDWPLPYSTVINRLKNLWNPSGGVKVRSTGKVFLFFIEKVEDREKILKADPIIIQNKLFIVRPWQSRLGDLTKTITSVPVWIKLTNLPLYSWSKTGICYLATRVGKFLCMDLSTEKLERLEYAKCMVEVTPNEELPEKFPVLLPDESEQFVYVTYLWKPEICVECVRFGHSTAKCEKLRHDTAKAANLKVLTKQPERISSENEYPRNNVNAGPSLRNGTQSRISAEWRIVPSKSKVGEYLDKGKAVQGDGNSRKLSFSVLSDMQEDVLVEEEEEICEEGEIRQVSELLSRAFPVGTDNNAATLLNACSGDLLGCADGIQSSGTSEGLRSGKVLQRSMLTNDEKNVSATYLSDVNLDGDVGDCVENEAAHASDKICSVRLNVESQLDPFLQFNFDCTDMNIIENQKQCPSVKYNFGQQEKKFRQSIQCLRDEIGSGKLDDVACSNKLKLLEIMTKNCNSINSNEAGKLNVNQPVVSIKPSLPALKPGFLNTKRSLTINLAECSKEISKTCSPVCKAKDKGKKKSNPYDHIPPPPGFKAPPPDSFNLSPVAVSSSGRPLGSAPITRRKKIELLKGLEDDMG